MSWGARARCPLQVEARISFCAPEAERLLWRAGFGPRPGEARALARLGLEGTVHRLTHPGPEHLVGHRPHDEKGRPLAPLDAWGHDHVWWLDKMVRTSRPLVERMTLIWHDWFATSNSGVGSQRLMLNQNQLFRQRGLGSFHDLLLEVTKDPAMLLWLNGSDKPPPPEVEQAYLQVLTETSWPNPIVSSASQTPADSGPSGVKMTGPYDYVPPSYWLIDTKHGGAYGFNTETSPGPAVPTTNSLNKFIPPDHLWPIDEVWNFHSGGSRFKTLEIYNAALNAEYGPPTDLDDYNRKSQAMAYDGERAMFEKSAAAANSSGSWWVRIPPWWACSKTRNVRVSRLLNGSVQRRSS